MVNLHHLTLQGLPDSEQVNILFDPYISVIWKNCSNIEISSISFSLLDYFTYGIVFKHSNLVQISNVSVFGNEFFGCSSVMSQHSTLVIKDSSFVGIQGTFGAALMIFGSCVIFTGNNKFVGNRALFGGSLYLFESTVTLNGISTFMNNNSSKGSWDYYCIYSAGVFINIDDYMKGSGGVIYYKSSTLIINSEYSIFANNSAQLSGGAIAALSGNITIRGFIRFMNNVAYECEGGAISLFTTTLIVSGNISFINNEAYYSGGALSLFAAKFLLIVSEEWILNEKSIFSDAIKFCCNVAINGGMTSIAAKYVGVLESTYSNYNVSVKGMATFCGNIASSKGGAINNDYNSDITVDGGIYFESNRAANGGGMYIGHNSKLIVSLSTQENNNMVFVLNHANDLGGALYIEDSQCSNPASECFIVTIQAILLEVLLSFFSYTILLEQQVVLCMEDNLTSVGYTT